MCVSTQLHLQLFKLIYSLFAIKPVFTGNIAIPDEVWHTAAQRLENRGDVSVKHLTLNLILFLSLLLEVIMHLLFNLDNVLS